MKKVIAQEYPTPDESEYISKIVEDLKGQMVKLWPNGTKMLRQAETKMHGCLKAQFVVNPDLEEQYKVGVFAEAKTYDTIIRFSNAKTGIVADIKKDQRGMALKLIGVKGEKLMLDEHLAETQDFIGLNTPTFVSKSVKEFHGLLKAFTTGKLALLLFILNPLHWPLMLRVAKGSSKIGSLLEQDYHSTTAFQFGANRAMKFMFRSSLNGETKIPKDPSPDYLKEQMAEFLSHSGVSFDFLVQFQEDANKMPIEDPTVKWTSNYVKLATIIIPKQEFDQDQNRLFGEALSFNPWHSLPAHRPLGGLNRARLAIYGQLSEFRNKSNGQKEFEPKDMSFNLNP
jgi:hypothetical protein